MIKRLVCVAYFLEVGLLLVLVPWTAFWERNYLAVSLPLFQNLLRNNFMRGGVSGLGVVNLLLGFYELAGLLSFRRGLVPPSGGGTEPPRTGEARRGASREGGAIPQSGPAHISSLVNEE